MIKRMMRGLPKLHDSSRKGDLILYEERANALEEIVVRKEDTDSISQSSCISS
jgi:hypothetical protein